ncbi:MAG TPA: hypothetical protein VI997_11260, partial [Candidatus Thermoplasmatota archaeon]|nr:hypothetical protein [Candidatus Thermoplasmatota archaeon]
RFPVAVEPNATLLLARLEADVGALQNGDFDLFVYAPNGDRYNMTPDEPLNWRPNRPFGGESVSVPYEQLLAGGTGDWSVEVVYAGGTLPQAAYTISGAVYYNLSRSTELIVAGPALLKPGESHTFTFDLIATTQNPQVAMVYGGKAIAYNKHTDPNAQDWGNYTKWSTLTYTIGTQSVIGPVNEITAGGALVALGPAMRAWGQVLGFAGSFVLIPAIVLGGVFGRGSITALNSAFGGARRRVLFHNSTSYGLLIFTVLHMGVLLLEPIWAWTHGLVLGGLALACMIGLALTGAFQRRLVVAWGFPRWRFVHFALGVLVVFFVVAHLVVDGTHFEWARALFGETNSGGQG